MGKKQQQNKRQFAQDFGMLMERLGLPPMAGRIWGWLLVCDPPHQTEAQLANAVGASRGGISTMTRLLVQFGIAERIGLPGERSRFYRIKSGGFTELLKNKMLAMTEVRKMADRGLELLKDEPPQLRRRLREYRDFYAFFERELPVLIERWKKERAGA